jgi:oligopeptide transport system substrate-binding protein
LLLGLCAVGVFIALLIVLGALSRWLGGSQIAGAALDPATKTITLALQQEPPQLDSTRSTDKVSSFVLGHIMEGLVRYDEHNELVPGVAERWEIRPDGATFLLRADARWSDGKPVTAHDFAFAWSHTVDPATGSQYAYLMYPIKNAEAINTRQLPLDTLGVHAKDDRTFEVEFERPVPYFEKLIAYKTFLPIRADFFESRRERYAADADDLLFNGPFMLTRWVHGAHVRLEKNPMYWDRERIRLNVIDMPYVTNDTNALLNLYRDGKIAMVGQEAGIGSESLKQALVAGWPIHQMKDGSVWYLLLNHRPGRLTRNLHLRKAMQLVVDNNELLYRVLKTPGDIPMLSYFPAWLRGKDGLFRQEYPPREIKLDVAEARRHLELARQELKLDKWPPLVLMTDDTPNAIKKAEYFQSVLKEKLGLPVRIDSQIFKLRLAKAEAGDFDICIYGWGPDYDDPLTFGDMFETHNPNNHGRYSNPEMDRLVKVARTSLDTKTRMDAFGKIQDLLIEDAVIIMNYERGQLYIQHPRLEGVVRRAIGPDPDLSNAYIVEES